MASINQRGGKLFFDLRWQGKRYREYTTVPDTPSNRSRAEAVLAQMTRAMKRGEFDYGQYFPEGPHAEAAAPPTLLPVPPVVPSPPPRSEAVSPPITQPAPSSPSHEFANARSTPAQTPSTMGVSFAVFAETWFSEMQPQWRRSYRNNLRTTLDGHLLPAFGGQDIASITKADILSFRSRLTEPRKGKPNGLSPSRINHILCLFKQILDEAADRHQFLTPYRNIKPLRIPRTDVAPFDFDEIALLLKHVEDAFRPYYTVRFFTGLRTAEIDGLQWQYVDFERQQILIRETLVDGYREDTKTSGAYRTVDLSPRVIAALEEQARRTQRFDYVFCDEQGRPLDHRKVTKHVWYPLLKRLNLKKRRPYQTRHTAATLWLAAGENPQWIARQLGHSAQMLFDTYARYVPNLTRQDGSAFEALLEQRFETQNESE